MADTALRVLAAISTAQDVFRLLALQIDEVNRINLRIAEGQATVDAAQAIADGLEADVAEQLASALAGVASAAEIAALRAEVATLSRVALKLPAGAGLGLLLGLPNAYPVTA